MNDLDMLMGLRPETALPEIGELGAVRDLLVAAISAERANGVAPAPAPIAVPSHAVPPTAVPSHAVPPGRVPAGGRRARAFWPARRLALTGVAVAAVAAVGAAAIIALPGHGAPPAARPATALPSSVPPAARSKSVPPSARHSPGAPGVAAARLLRHAALAALQLPTGAPGPDQFVYTESEGANRAESQLWMSADGASKGLSRSPNGKTYVVPRCTIAQAEAKGCYPSAGFFPDMPTSAAVLLAYLNKLQITNTQNRPADSPGWVANDIGKGIFYLMGMTYLLPAQRAALYELMAQTPGFTVVHGVRDAIGRTGVGVEWKFEGGKGAVILNPRTYAYLGVRTWPVPGFHGPGAHAYDGDALIKIAIVNKAGELP